MKGNDKDNKNYGYDMNKIFLNGIKRDSREERDFVFYCFSYQIIYGGVD